MVKLICGIMIFLFLAVGCSYQGSYFGVKNQAIMVPGEFGQTEEAIERAEKSPEAKYCPEKLVRAREKAKEGVRLYWSCPWIDCSEEAMVTLAEARKLAHEAELCQPPPPPSPPAPEPGLLATKPAATPAKPAETIAKPTPTPPPTTPGPTWLEETALKAKVVKFEGVYFPFDSYRLTPEAVAILDEHVVILKEDPEIKVEVAGHTDDRGTISYNKALSERRAKAVKMYFVSEGISSDRLKVVGYGGGRPIVSNDTEEGRAKNSRVEMKIIE